MAAFEHRKFEVYRDTMALIAFAGTVTAGLGSGFFVLKDQLIRAAISIAMNIGEGAGEYAPREKARFYRMARRSASEAISGFDALLTLRVDRRRRVGRS